MSTSTAFVLPLKGLGKGLYEYDLKVDDAFFASFPESPIPRADIDLHLMVDKQNREMVVDFNFSGTIATECDRCLADIDLPVGDRRQLIVKFAADEEERDEGDLVYLHPDTNDFNLAPFIYEMVALSVPMIRTYDCRAGEPPYPCDEDLLDRIDASYDTPEEAPSADPGEEDAKPSPWDILKDLNNN